MKFGKNLLQVVELSDPEWGPYWINYKLLKKKINDIVTARGGMKVAESNNCNPRELSKSACEVEFFKSLRIELNKTSEFFASSEKLYCIRHERVFGGYVKLQEDGKKYDKNSWSRLLRACIRLYKDVLLLENFAIMNYCGFSKILKKHDKLTGFVTREAFMRNVMSVQNFTRYPYLLELLKQSEQLFAEIQGMDSVMPLQEEERLFLDAIRDLNYQASQLQAEENDVLNSNTNSENSNRSNASVDAISPQPVPEGDRNPTVTQTLSTAEGNVHFSSETQPHLLKSNNSLHSRATAKTTVPSHPQQQQLAAESRYSTLTESVAPPATAPASVTAVEAAGLIATTTATEASNAHKRIKIEI
ncbi:unnamed protein product [Sphagnum jensenii]|uniref:SPX domain-containing protein n=1 Tax=Sphagnum jensenii TaxID=128206 RepID=A0ABP0VCE8_9BRYO